MNGVLGWFKVPDILCAVLFLLFVSVRSHSKCIISPGMLHMLMDTQLDVTQQDYVRTAQASGRALVSLINEVLDQAKIESGKLELEAVRFDLRAILDDVLSLFSGKSHDKGVEVLWMLISTVSSFTCQI